MIITINGRALPVLPDETLLQAARRAGVDIPTLCHHEGLEDWGGCRLCVVELKRPGQGEAAVVPSCMQRVEDGVAIETHSERVLRIRAALLDLLLARAPEAAPIQALAREHGIMATSFEPRPDPDRCILCNVCVRVCEKVGAHALSTAGRGAEGGISLPFGDDASACIGCAACAESCPTDAIEMRDLGTTRHIWGRDFERAPCTICGAPTLTREHAAFLAERTSLPADAFEVCDDCRRQATSKTFNHVILR